MVVCLHNRVVSRLRITSRGGVGTAECYNKGSIESLWDDAALHGFVSEAARELG